MTAPDVISPAATRVLFALARVQRADGYGFGSLARVAAESGLSVNSRDGARVHLGRLAIAGLVERVNVSRDSTRTYYRYRIAPGLAFVPAAAIPCPGGATR